MICINTQIRILFAVFFFYVFQSFGQPLNAAADRQIIVVFRYDSYSSLSPTDMEVKLIDAFHKHNIACTFGVIPYMVAKDPHDPNPQNVVPLTADKADILMDAIKNGTLEVALHGYSHQTCRNRIGFTEFSGLDYDTQVKKIMTGKSLLEQMLKTPCTTFIPPWNRYDLTTLQALEKLNFKCISAGAIPDVGLKESSSLKFLPHTCYVTNLRDVVKEARSNPHLQSIIVCVFHEYELFEINKKRGRFTYREFNDLLDWLTSQKDIRVATINEVTSLVDDLNGRRYMNYVFSFKPLWKPLSLLPPFISELYHFPAGAYLPLKNTDTLRIRLWGLVLILNFATLFLCMAISFYGTLILFPRSSIGISICKYGLMTCLALIFLYSVHDMVIGYKGLSTTSAALGACIGVWISSIKLKKQGCLKQIR
jgi:hypothetical protein